MFFLGVSVFGGVFFFHFRGDVDFFFSSGADSFCFGDFSSIFCSVSAPPSGLSSSGSVPPSSGVVSSVFSASGAKISSLSVIISDSSFGVGVSSAIFASSLIDGASECRSQSGSPSSSSIPCAGGEFTGIFSSGSVTGSGSGIGVSSEAFSSESEGVDTSSVFSTSGRDSHSVFSGVVSVTSETGRSKVSSSSGASSSSPSVSSDGASPSSSDTSLSILSSSMPRSHEGRPPSGAVFFTSETDGAGVSASGEG